MQMTRLSSETGNPWSYSLRVCLIGILVVFTARIIGLANTEQDRVSVLVHSAVVVIVGYVCLSIFAPAVMRFGPNRVPMLVRAVAGCLVGAAPASLIAPSASWILGVLPLSLGVGDTRADLLADIADRLPNIYLVFSTLGTSLWMVLNFALWVNWLEGRSQRQVSPANEAPTNPEVRSVIDEDELMRELPPAKRGTVIAISAEGHYVRLHTDVGSDLVLMRFKDAIDRMPTEDGLRIHRSHWVRKSAIVTVMEESRSRAVQLTNGEEFPISRSNLNLVREVVSKIGVQADVRTG